jgi:hypothetical protein
MVEFENHCAMGSKHIYRRDTIMTMKHAGWVITVMAFMIGCNQSPKPTQAAGDKSPSASRVSATVNPALTDKTVKNNSEPNLPDASVTKVVINGLTLEFDRQTGGLVRMSYPGVGTLLDTTPELAGLVDAAIPLPEFEALRLASRFSKGVRIEKIRDGVIIHYENMGLSRSLDIGGAVSANVEFRAASDGRSIIMKCGLTNNSKYTIPQVIFPQFREIPPFGGKADTVFQTTSSANYPWLEMAVARESPAFPFNNSWMDFSFPTRLEKGYATNLRLRWADLGSVKGGFSVFPKCWGFKTPAEWGTPDQVLIKLFMPETTQKLHVLFMNEKLNLQPGQSWHSEEFWLTPHTQGWAKGIEPFRDWVKQNYKPLYPIPNHIRDGLGFRTVWMRQIQTLPSDPQGDIIWKFKDLVPLAKEAKEHGLTEICIWEAFRFFRLPMQDFWPVLGTEQEFIQAVQECKKMGVTVSIFLSLFSMDRESCERYGWKFMDVSNASWNWHADLVPPLAPYYCKDYAVRYTADTNDPRWQKDIIDGVQRLVDLGVTSFGWDQWAGSGIYAVSTRIRELAKAKDPQSSYYSELYDAYEKDGTYLDYTWIWGRMDNRALINVVSSPRQNFNIHRSINDVRMGFADNLFLNLMPSKLDGPPGSAWIKDYPQVSQAVKQCARFREQFLPYFTQGTLIGECILCQPKPYNIHVSSYILPDRALIVVVNKGASCGNVDLQVDIEPWLTSSAANYQVQVYREANKIMNTLSVDGKRISIPTGPLEKDSLIVYELLPKE